jgi:hypothetical protein
VTLSLATLCGVVAAVTTAEPAPAVPAMADSAPAVQAKAEPPPSRFTAFFDSSFSRGFYEDDLAYASINGKIRYAFSAQFDLRLSAGIKHGFTEYKDDRRRYDVEDPVLALSYCPTPRRAMPATRLCGL